MVTTCQNIKVNSLTNLTKHVYVVCRLQVTVLRGIKFIICKHTQFNGHFA